LVVSLFESAYVHSKDIENAADKNRTKTRKITGVQIRFLNQVGKNIDFFLAGNVYGPKFIARLKRHTKIILN